MADDELYIATRHELQELLTRKFTKTVYHKTFKGIPAAQLVHGIYVHKRANDEISFPEALSEFMKNTDQKIASINVRVD